MSDEESGSRKSMASMSQQSHKLLIAVDSKDSAFRLYICLATCFVLESTGTAVLQLICYLVLNITAGACMELTRFILL